ncbi:MAG: hypothetical protein WCQ67_00295 [Treponema sp.]
MPVNKSEIDTYKPAAIITVYGNTTVPLYDGSTSTAENYKVQQTDDGIITGLINRAIDKDNVEQTTANERINYAAALFEKTLLDKNIEIISAEKIQKSSGYANTVKNFINALSNTKAAQNYSIVPESNSITNKRIAREAGAKSLYYVHFKFQKENVKDGVHVVGVRARTAMTVYACDSKSKTLIANDYSSSSEKYTLYSNSKYDKEELCSFFETTIDNVINEFASDCF